MGLLTMKTVSRKLAMPLLGVLLWVLSIHAGTFATATLLPPPVTGFGRSSIFYHKAREDPLEDPNAHIIHMKIPGKDLNQSVVFGSGIVSRMQRLETNLDWSNIHVRKGSPAHGQLLDSSPEKEALRQGRAALVASKATVHLMNNHCARYNLNPADCAKYIASFKMSETPLHSTCEKLRKSCSQEQLHSKYRTIDGSCNHFSDGSLGASFTGYKRLLFADYLDGIQEPRRSVNKKHGLPSPRVISNALVKHSNVEEKELTLAVMQWGQFVGHDLAHTATNKMVHSGNTIECCEPGGYNLSPRYIHPFCAPISVPLNDAYYSKHNVECMPYVRSIAAIRSDCSFGPLEQVNQATHYLDGSQIYGSDLRKARVLRKFVNGQLEVTTKQAKSFLPLSENPTQDCQVDSDSAACFVSGDTRVNIQPQLAAMHTIWHREHNRVAEELALVNPHWEDETLYQEARRIVIAEMQSITYNEWLPTVLGKKYIAKIHASNGYNEHIDPSISNSFATAAIRFLSSLMEGKVKLYDEVRDVNKSLSLRDHFNRPHILQKHGHLDGLIRGLATQHSQKLDMDYVKELTSDLFFGDKYGYDILSLDIQRGRDHGLPGYTAYRSLCGLQDVEGFEDLLDVMPLQTIKSLSEVYHSPHDIDLLVGGLAERPDGDSLLGPTLSCIVADQFLRTRRGDRYFYSNEDQPVPFSKAQIREIDRISLARIFCDNGDDIETMQNNVFKRLSVSNDLVPCDSIDIPHLNLKLWAENRSKYF